MRVGGQTSWMNGWGVPTIICGYSLDGSGSTHRAACTCVVGGDGLSVHRRATLCHRRPRTHRHRALGEFIPLPRSPMCAGQSARARTRDRDQLRRFPGHAGLTWSFPLTLPIRGRGGIGVVWEPLSGGVKYRFFQEDDDGWEGHQVAFFPQVFIPVGPANRGAPVTELFPGSGCRNLFGAWTMSCWWRRLHQRIPDPVTRTSPTTASRYSDKS